jgi:cytosine/adenosine deaminase-related metal-dependent hydrolase
MFSARPGVVLSIVLLGASVPDKAAVTAADAGAVHGVSTRGVQQARAIGIAHVTVIDVEHGTRLRDQTIVIEAGRISTIGPSSQVRVPDGYGAVDGRGKFVIPGFVDARLLSADSSIASRAIDTRALESDLLRGVTTVVRPEGRAIDVSQARAGAVLPRFVEAREERRSGSAVAFADAVPGAVLRLAASGLTPAAALKAVTYDAARAAGVADRIGSVARGRLADLVILSANPLDAIANIASIDAIVIEGRFIDGAERNALLSKLR